MYLLFLDESGTHGGSEAFVLGGLAIHEQDAWHLQRSLHQTLKRKLPKGLDPFDFELHANDIKSPRGPSKKRKASEWQGIPYGVRLSVLHGVYEALAKYKVQNEDHPMAYFGAVVNPKEYKDSQQRAYEEVLHRFDEMLTRGAHTSGEHQRGIVIHDRHVIEKDVQDWTTEWRQIAGRASKGRIGKLTHLADVPLFADSRASRLIQAADFICYALWRYYGLPSPDEKWIKLLWDKFDSHGGTMHGLVHVVKGFRSGKCACPPCFSRTKSVGTSIGA